MEIIKNKFGTTTISEIRERKIEKEPSMIIETARTVGSAIGKASGKSTDFLLKRDSSKTAKVQAKFIQKAPEQTITKSQAMMRSLFGHENRTFGTGQNLPKVDGVLISGQGLLKHDDNIERRTGRMFGLR